MPKLNPCAVPPSLLQAAQGPVSVRWSTSVVNGVECAVITSPSLGTVWDDSDMLLKPGRAHWCHDCPETNLFEYKLREKTWVKATRSYGQNVRHSPRVPTANTNLEILLVFVVFLSGVQD